MVLILLCIAKLCPHQGVKRKLINIANRIRLQCYGGISPREMQQLRAEIFSDIQHLLRAAKLHDKTFNGFKGAFKGKDLVIVGAGPSVKKFKPLEKCIYIGLNRACALPGIKFDYLFAIDNLGIRDYYKEFASHDCVKFVGDQGIGAPMQIPEDIISTFGNKVRRYMTDSGHLDCRDSHFAVDLTAQVLGNFNTVAMQAMQFALYTNPKRIFLVGIDCSSAGHFDSNDKKDINGAYIWGSNFWANRATDDWRKLKAFVKAYYPETQIVSVNPVGLKGLFLDIYQEELD